MQMKDRPPLGQPEKEKSDHAINEKKNNPNANDKKFAVQKTLEIEDPLLPSGEKKTTYKSRAQITFIIENIALGSFYFGYCVVYFSQIDIEAMLDVLSYHELNTSVAKGLLNGAIPIGGLIGALLSSILMKKLSRRKCLLLVNFFALLVGGLIYIENFYTLLIFRFFQGVCVGIYSALIPLMIDELSPTEIRGYLGSFTQLNVSFGVLFGCVFAYALKKITGDLTGKQFWYYLYGFTEITLVIQTVVLLFVYPYETPKYLLSMGKQEEARKLIEVIFKEQYVNEVLDEKKSDLKAALAKQSLQTETVDADIYAKEAPKRSILAIIVAINLAALQQLSGVNALVLYAGEIASSITSGQVSLLMGVIVNFESFLGTFITGFLLATFGRKTILQIGTFLEGVANIFAAVGFFIWNYTDQIKLAEALVLLGLFLYMGVFGVSLGPVVWLYIPEVVEPKVVPFSTAVNWITASIIIILFPIITTNVLDGNPAYLFIFFAAICAGSWIFNAKFLIETKDKTHKDIHQEYDALTLC